MVAPTRKEALPQGFFAWPAACDDPLARSETTRGPVALSRREARVMNLNGKAMVAVAMMLGALGAVGCNPAEAATEPEQPKETASTAPVETPAATPSPAANPAPV